MKRIPAILLITGAIVRLASINTAAIWYDEAVTLYRTSLPFLSLGLDRSEYSGCLLLDLLVRPLMAIDRSVILLRLPSLLASWLCLWLVWVLMQRLKFTTLQQAITATFVAFSPGLLWLGQDARAYSLVAALGLTALLFALDGKYLGLLAVAGLTAYAHRTGPAIALAAFVVALYMHRSNWRMILLASLLTVLAWVPAFAGAAWYASSQEFWTENLDLLWMGLAMLQSILVWTWRGMTVFIPIALFVGTLVLIFRKDALLLALAWIVPLAAMITVSMLWKNVIMYRTLMPLLFPFGLWLGWVLGRRPFRIYQAAVLIGWTIILAVSLTQYDPTDRGGRIDQAADLIRSQWRTGDAILYTTFTTQAPFDYYLPDLPAALWTGVSNPFQTPPDLHVNTTLPEHERLWVITLDEPSLPAEEQAAIHDLTAGGTLVLRLDTAPQFAPIEIWLVEK
jgi:hypothetical protein